MSILDHEAFSKYPDMLGMKRWPMISAYVKGASRKPTEAEVEAAAKAVFEKSWVEIHHDPTMNWEDDLDDYQRDMYMRIALCALNAARAKAMEDHQ